MPIDEKPLLVVDDVTLTYGRKGKIVVAAEAISFNANRSDRIVLLGPSGCGKSSLLKAIGGYLPPTGGSITLAGKRVAAPGPDRMMVFQEFDQLLPWKTVLANIMFPMLATGVDRAEAEARARRFLNKVKLAKFADSYPNTLSGGMKQRVAIARGMAMQPEIILMDEPFAALDALSRQEMQNELMELWEETRPTILFVTHSIAEAIKVGSKIVLLSPHPGRVKEIIDLARPHDPAELDKYIYDTLFAA
nr:ABC transporter ATP-binding protein [uncultured Devosia sp.]